MQTSKSQEWMARLFLPAYQVGAAAAYAGVTSHTVRNWQKAGRTGNALAHRHPGSSLSYMQLQELAIVSAMRKLGVKLAAIKTARQYLGSLLATEFPFADERVKSDGQDNLLLGNELPRNPADTLIVANRGGQLAWSEIIGRRFSEFEYEKGLALKWHMSGDGRVVIDPRVSFGAPTVRGVPTWALRGREAAGERLEDIAEDFGITTAEVKTALEFEHSLVRH